MDFADDFTYFTMSDVLREVKRLYGQNRYVTHIGIAAAANDAFEIKIWIKNPKHLKITQMGLPLRFRNVPVVFQEACNDPVF